MTFQDLLERTVAIRASDLYLIVGVPPIVRVAAREVLLNTPAITKLIRENQVAQIP